MIILNESDITMKLQINNCDDHFNKYNPLSEGFTDTPRTQRHSHTLIQQSFWKSTPRKYSKKRKCCIYKNVHFTVILMGGRKLLLCPTAGRWTVLQPLKKI